MSRPAADRSVLVGGGPDPCGQLAALGARLTPQQRVHWACVLEATIPKLGNVTPADRFADLGYEDFCAAAAAIGPILGNATAESRVGDLVYRSIAATRAVSRSNVNLGIVLLLAPLVIAAARCRRDGVPRATAVAGVLQSMDARDAHRVYSAIRLASPGGMGRASRNDLQQSPPEDLLVAMRDAAERDAVARQYATNFGDLVAGKYREALREAGARTASLWSALSWWQVRLLATDHDSLVARKLGAVEAEAFRRRAESLWPMADRVTAWAELDAWARATGHRRNPGTTADLIAAGLWLGLSGWWVEGTLPDAC